MLESYPIVTTVVASIILAFSFGVLANLAKIPTILGYLLAGMVIGPNTPGFVANIDVAEQVAEIGVILLMFGVGLHFSSKDLKIVHRTAIPGALIQMSLTTLLCASVSIFLGHSFSESFVFGITLSVASTVVLLRALEQHDLVNSRVGKIAIGWLIVEDIAMILILVLLPVISEMFESGKEFSYYKISNLIIVNLFKIGAFLLIMNSFGKKILPKILILISKTKSNELMVLGVVAISSGFAFVAYTIFGASFALGSFMAGFILSGSKIGRKYAERSLPLRDTFAVLFFVAAGMLFNPKILLEDPLLVLIAFILVTAGKSFVAYFTMRIFRQGHQNSIILSISLSQIGEFSFILAALSMKLGIFSNLVYDMVIASAIISIAINPFLFKLAALQFKKE